MEKYSVLMSVYKNEKVLNLKYSINSMLNQTIKPDEIVVVKDGPLTNDLDSALEEYKESHPKLFQFVELKNNVGLGLALNEGLKVCRYNLVARMDTDDISLLDRCEKQLKVFDKNPEIAIVGTNTDEFYDTPTNIITSREVPESHDEIMKFSKRRSPFNHPTVMYKKEVITKLGGYSDLRRNQDYELFVRLLNSGYKSRNINESLLLFRANKENDKRRKSWERVKLDISLRYRFWKMGYHGFLDFLFSSIGLLTLYFSPVVLFNLLSSKFLRKRK
jgi:glycosyltransferase involved in cell wall biosynthesis